MHFQHKRMHNCGDGEKLIKTIVNKSNGVFLWVRLVVEELLRGFRDGETIRTLQRKTEQMPADLENFFKRIMESIDPAYRKRRSCIPTSSSVKHTRRYYPVVARIIRIYASGERGFASQVKQYSLGHW